MRANDHERRRFLRTLGGAVLAAPFLSDLLCASALAQGKAPRRLIIWTTAMGTIKPHWVHPPGPLGTLGKLLAPLQPYTRDISLVLTGGGGVHNGGGHPALGRLLTGIANGGNRTAGPGMGASVDQFPGKRIGSATRLPVLELGLQLAYQDGETFARAIFAEGNEAMSSLADPLKVFQRMYGMGAGAPGPVAAGTSMSGKAMFDLLAREITALRGKIPSAERAKMDVHLGAIRDIEKQLGALATQTCAPPEAPKVEVSGMNTPAVMKAQIDLMVNALACDMTRVVSFQIGQEGNGSMRFPFIGWPNVFHAYSHDEKYYGDGGAMYQMHLWYAEQFAYLLSRLESVRDGDGTLLDNTLVAWLTTMGEGRRHDSGDLPLVFAGRAGGAVRTGQSIKLGRRYINDFHTTICHVMGVPVDGYGDPMLSTGPVTELLS